MDLGLKDKVVMVAGASQGLGYGAARAAAHEGARVSICSRRADAIQAAAARLSEETGAPVIAAACDVRDPAAIQAWTDSTVSAWGRVDGLFVNAGGPPAGSFKELSDAQWQAAFELILLSAIRLIRAALPHMLPGSAIVASTSSSIIEPNDRLALSSVIRAGVAGLVKTLAEELAPDGIRVNNLIPGRIDTERVVQLDRGTAERLGVSIEEIRARSLATIPLGRLGTIDDYGAAAAFLLSPAASYITGTSLRVDGGKLRSL